MVNTKVLINMARKRKRNAAIGRKRIYNPSTACETSGICGTSSSAAPKGHFVVYSIDKQRFVVPVCCSALLSQQTVVCALFDKSEEEFGLSSDGHITMPIDAYTMRYLIASISKGLAKEQENALLLFVDRSNCSSYFASTFDNEMRYQPIYVL